jgi:glycosyltransferase involved in cell wall biosynthesis
MNRPYAFAALRNLSQSFFHTIVHSDGSGEKYADIFESVRPYAHILSHIVNKGKGCALKTGLLYILQNSLTGVVVTVDADGQHTAGDAKKVAQQAAVNPDALTLGVRAFGPGTPARSYFGNIVTRLVYRLSTGRRVSDTQTGLRAFGTALAPVIADIGGDRYEYEMNVLMVCAQYKILFQEVAIETVYTDGNKHSHFRTIRDSVLIYGNIFKFAGSSLLAFALDYGLYSLLAVLTAGLGTAVSVPLSNIAARIVSAGTNFAVNKRYVFKNRGSVLKTAHSISRWRPASLPGTRCS